MIKPQTLKGFRDFLPEEMRLRNYVLETCKKVFESFGFEPLETPALEYASTLLGRYGDEADKLIYQFEDRGGRKVGLRYDLTVPLARVIASYSNLSRPFKRYQLQPVWRADKPQAGRFREFLQCDADIIGTKSPLADAEIIIITAKCLKKLGFEKFAILINDRWVIFDVLARTNISKEKRLSVIRTLDKWEKIKEKGVREELIKKGSPKNQVDELLEEIKKARRSPNLNRIFEYLKSSNLSENQIEFLPTLARGLDYYTGMIFEVQIDGYTGGSVAGGGRYDTMIGFFAEEYIPAVGFSFGIDRLVEAIKQKGLLKDLPETTTKVLVTTFSQELLKKSLKLASKLRGVGINTDLYPEPEVRLDKQLKYANKKGIPYVIILGPEEIKEEKYTLKEMKTGKQKRVNFQNLVKILQDASRKK